jgi:hypothetical protein
MFETGQSTDVNGIIFSEFLLCFATSVPQRVEDHSFGTQDSVGGNNT